MVNSKRKGSQGEREVAAKLRELGFANAHRGRQYKGGDDSPDVQSGIPGTHWEVKRYKRLGLCKRALAQANEEKADGDVPVAVMREDGDTRWMVAFYLDDIELFTVRVFKELLIARLNEDVLSGSEPTQE